MLEAPFTLIGEVIIPLVSGAIELTVMVLMAGVRPWAYVLLPSERRKTQAKLAGQHLFAKLWYMLWGTAALVASTAIIVAVSFWFFRTTEPTPVTKERAVAEELASGSSALPVAPAQLHFYPDCAKARSDPFELGLMNARI